MIKNITSKIDATREWVRGFNALPQSLIQKAYLNQNIDDIFEITPVVEDRQAWSNEYQSTYEVISIDRENETAIINVDDEEIETKLNDLSVEYDSFLPMWGTMWFFEEGLDDDWARENLYEMAKCGFRIYETEELGILFGIDGAGYNFYEQHWIPLYEARGLQWHDKEEDEN